MKIKISIALFALVLYSTKPYGQDQSIVFGTESTLEQVNSGSGNEKSINWINVNTEQDTWYTEKELLICKGIPIGVMRSEKQYENFILQIEWRHMESGGNSGVFVWSDANPDPKSRLPGGVEVQMLELDWVKLNKRDG